MLYIEPHSLQKTVHEKLAQEISFLTSHFNQYTLERSELYYLETLKARLYANPAITSMPAFLKEVNFTIFMARLKITCELLQAKARDFGTKTSVSCHKKYTVLTEAVLHLKQFYNEVNETRKRTYTSMTNFTAHFESRTAQGHLFLLNLSENVSLRQHRNFLMRLLHFCFPFKKTASVKLCVEAHKFLKAPIFFKAKAPLASEHYQNIFEDKRANALWPL